MEQLSGYKLHPRVFLSFAVCWFLYMCAQVSKNWIALPEFVTFILQVGMWTFVVLIGAEKASIWRKVDSTDG